MLVSPAFSRQSDQPLLPSLTLALLAALTPSCVRVQIIDDNFGSFPIKDTPDIAGVTCNIANAARAYKLADHLRGLGTYVVMGGHHVSAVPDEALLHCDSVVIGDAEELWPRCINDYRSGQPAKVYGPYPARTPLRLPIPRYDLLPTREYALPYVPVEISRGCDRKCTFCNVGWPSGYGFVGRPVEDVVRDIRTCGESHIFFADDNMTGGGVESTRALLEAVGPLGIQWISECDILLARNQELLHRAAQSGCVGLYVGLESINQRSLDGVNKAFNCVDEFPELIARFHDEGILLIASMVFGFDEDEPDVFDRTVEFLQGNGIAVATFFILTPAPGSPIWRQMVRQNRILHRDWSKYDDTHVVFEPKRMSQEELVEGLWRSYRTFYSTDYVRERLQSVPHAGVGLAKRLISHYDRAISGGIHPLIG